MVVLLAILAVMGSGLWEIYQKEREARALRDEARVQLADLEERENELRADIASLRTERGMEAELRRQFGLAAEGEELIVIVEPPEPEPIREPTFIERVRFWMFW